MTHRRLLPVLLLSLFVPPSAALAQDPVEQGVRIGITYTPGLRPGMLVLGGPRAEMLDTVRAILERDLDYSDQFEIISLPGGDSVVLGISGPQASGGAGGLYVNYSLYAALGAEYSVAVLPSPDPSEFVVAVYDVKGENERRRVTLTAMDPLREDFRLSVHRAADAILQAVTGSPGFAATRLLFIQHGGLYRIDADGANLTPVSPPGVTAFSSAWAPGGMRAAYAQLENGQGRIVIHDFQTGGRRTLRDTETLLNISPGFSADGGSLVFTRIAEEGTEVYRYNLARDCCLERLTVGRFSDNLSPTFSPDGRQIAFVTTRAGGTQIYVMAADGTGQELFAPFDYGVTGNSYAPEWSPDGTQITFHRDVMGSPQVFVMATRSRQVRQLTSSGRNEDPTWAPDGRHIAFISNRTGRRQVWVIDIETGRVRQLTTVGDARLPAWSPRLP
jgi:TolB protein